MTNSIKRSSQLHWGARQTPKKQNYVRIPK
nr:MAG TPA: hypothetical protein [Caudoviricetes sp.]DAK04038.1 MAG TPA: hypothetical protein [Caudoviricetes sp.]DAK29825.1 MAG TPA: hypothetical protein [Caudoviricetes sp.]DAM64999.1 MAG TPA: hypothetical protein [Caudoviricetes sp.]DAN68541.1 MAG TPA: hypothetical protein [Caudoviricetes sp.]